MGQILQPLPSHRAIESRNAVAAAGATTPVVGAVVRAARIMSFFLLAVSPAITGWPIASARAAPAESTPAPAADAAVNGGGRDRATGDPEGILDLDIDQLGKVAVVAPALQEEVSTVARTESTVGKSPAAVFVITPEMIRRAGARSIPEALRLAPGVHVARVDGNRYAISIRGFTGLFTNKLLVQIDGRTVYTPVFAGVYWDMQDVVLEDVERIEVIRGPGATIWGANAVNGVINIITKDAAQTQGGLLEAGGGTFRQDFATGRYGGRLGQNGHYRVFGQWDEHARGYSPAHAADDDGRIGHAGFRADWKLGQADHLTLQGDYQNGYSGVRSEVAGPFPTFRRVVDDDERFETGNVLGRWTRTLGDESDYSIQFYYDRTERHHTLLPFAQDVDICDLDFQHRFPLGRRHAVIWGFGYRNTHCEFQGDPYYINYVPRQRTDNLFSYFVQDQITLVEDHWYFIAGSKFEHNDFTGFEYQPSGRLLWTPTERHCVWAAISRAVRTPSLSEFDARILLKPKTILPGPLPVFPQGWGNDQLQSEELLAYEIGMRAQPDPEFYWDLAAFFNDYHRLTGLVPLAPRPGTAPGGWPAIYLPYLISNTTSAETYGFEWIATYLPRPDWTLRAGYSLILSDFHEPPGVAPIEIGTNPKNMFTFWISRNFRRNVTADLVFRYLDCLTHSQVPSYFAMDARLAWQPRQNLEWFIVGRHLLAGDHWEFFSEDAAGNMATEVQPELFGGVTWKF